MLAEFMDPAILGFILIGVMLFSIFVGFPISFTLIFCHASNSPDVASKISIVATGAISNSAALHSPSVDRIRRHNLELLIQDSRSVLQSVVTA